MVINQSEYRLLADFVIVCVSIPHQHWPQANPPGGYVRLPYGGMIPMDCMRCVAQTGKHHEKHPSAICYLPNDEKQEFITSDFIFYPVKVKLNTLMQESVSTIEFRLSGTSTRFNCISFQLETGNACHSVRVRS